MWWGVYLNPPENVIVLGVDEKPRIQALERAQGWLKLPNGKALTGFQHDYKRHGTTMLFASLEVATGLVKGDHYKNYKRRRRLEFLDFMNGIVEQYPSQQIHVILDNVFVERIWRTIKYEEVTFSSEFLGYLLGTHLSVSYKRVGRVI